MSDEIAEVETPATARVPQKVVVQLVTPQVRQALDYFKYVVFSLFGDTEVDCWVAGGAVRDYFSVGSPHSDIDLFFKDQAAFEVVRDLMPEKAETIADSDNGLLLSFEHQGKRRKYHLIKRYLFSPEDTIRVFDFTVCCAAVTKQAMYTGNTFFQDLARRRLVVNQIAYPLSTLQRVQKYTKKGFWICNGGLLEVAKAVKDVDFRDPDKNSLEFYPDGSPRFVGVD